MSDILGLKQIHPILKSLIQKDGILLFEQIKDKYQPKKIKKIRLKEVYFENRSKLEELFESLEKKLKQQEVLLKYLSVVPIESGNEVNRSGLLKADFLKNGISESSLKTLLNNDIFEEIEEFVSRFPKLNQSDLKTISLSKNQLDTKEQFIERFDDHGTVLLHGITGSGKTEIYISFIQDALDRGQQVLFLVPEIALTTQIVNRLRLVFGDKMGVYHSKYSDNERVEVWRGIQSGRFSFVVGVRSAIFFAF